jgi:hypothetical protein
MKLQIKLRSLLSSIQNSGGWLLTDGSDGGLGEGKRNAFAAMPLAKNLTLTDRARRQTIPRDQFCFGGCVLVLLFFWGGAGERESNKF